MHATNVSCIVACKTNFQNPLLPHRARVEPVQEARHLSLVRHEVMAPSQLQVGIVQPWQILHLTRYEYEWTWNASAKTYMQGAACIISIT